MFANSWKKSHGADFVAKLKKSNRSMSRLRRAVESAKRDLSSTQSVDIEVDCLLDDVDFTAVLTRQDFEDTQCGTLSALLGYSQVCLGRRRSRARQCVRYCVGW